VRSDPPVLELCGEPLLAGRGRPAGAYRSVAGQVRDALTRAQSARRHSATTRITQATPRCADCGFREQCATSSVAEPGLGDRGCHGGGWRNG
jgi:hypothetical protein